MMRDHKPQGFFYLDHRTVDGKYGIITDIFITPGNVADQTPYISRIDHQVETFGFHIEAVGLDAGYATTSIAKQLIDRHIYAWLDTEGSKTEAHACQNLNLSMCQNWMYTRALWAVYWNTRQQIARHTDITKVIHLIAQSVR